MQSSKVKIHLASVSYGGSSQNIANRLSLIVIFVKSSIHQGKCKTGAGNFGKVQQCRYVLPNSRIGYTPGYT